MVQTDSLTMPAVTGAEKFCCGLLIVATLIYYTAVFWRYDLNAAHADEFVDVLWFIEIFLSRSHWQEWLAVIALPNHEHVTVINHLVYLLDYFLFNKIHFSHYTLLGVAVLLICCWVFADWLRQLIGGWYAAALAVGMFLNIYYWDASFWAMTAISNQVVILFALLAARSAAKNPSAIVLPLCWALLAVLSQFNGLLVLPALIVSSVFCHYCQGWPVPRRQLLVWAAVFLLTSTAYMVYENPFAADHLWRYVQYTDAGNLQAYFKPSYGEAAQGAALWLRAPLSVLTAVGASVFGLTNWIFAAALGLLLLSGLLLPFLMKGRMRITAAADRFYCSVLLFVLASLVLVAIGRGMGFGMDAVLAYRYRLYSFALLVLLVGMVLRWRAERSVRLSLLLVCVAVQMLSLHVLADIKRDRANVAISYYNWLIDGGMGRTQMPFYPHNQDLRLFNAYEQGYYNPYDAIDARHKPKLIESVARERCPQHQPVQSDQVTATASAATVVAWSKKARALAVEIRLPVQAVVGDAVFLFCGDTAYRMTVGEEQVEPATGHYWPLLILKKQLPPSQYVIYQQYEDGAYQNIGTISFR